MLPATSSTCTNIIYAPGFAATAQVDLGDALHKSLKSHKLIPAAEFGLGAQREDTTLAAAQGYFDLVKAQAIVSVAQQSVAISEEYEIQIHQAVEIGVAFGGDELPLAYRLIATGLHCGRPWSSRLLQVHSWLKRCISIQPSSW